MFTKRSTLWLKLVQLILSPTSLYSYLHMIGQGLQPKGSLPDTASIIHTIETFSCRAQYSAPGHPQNSSLLPQEQVPTTSPQVPSLESSVFGADEDTPDQHPRSFAMANVYVFSPPHSTSSYTQNWAAQLPPQGSGLPALLVLCYWPRSFQFHRMRLLRLFWEQQSLSPRLSHLTKVKSIFSFFK